MKAAARASLEYYRSEGGILQQMSKATISWDATSRPTMPNPMVPAPTKPILTSAALLVRSFVVTLPVLQA